MFSFAAGEKARTGFKICSKLFQTCLSSADYTADNENKTRRILKSSKFVQIHFIILTQFAVILSHEKKKQHT